MEAWPKREDTIVRIPHYTKEQKHFLLSRGRAGGRCWLLLRVGAREHLLFDSEAAQYVGAQTHGGLIAHAETWDEGMDFEQLTRILTR